ncbi:CRISPR-associated protein, Cas5e family [Ligilactobacillus sp. WC1T17]|uniref:CRISPR-associated protein, Cas5e family n=1 Tax=Ligilactobacillus ruminis TaxID=1623 RepID=A0ABY1AA26_9LACO|nr:CRISPR-associated protein, Cas5e family [Ligilactobacillus ruminis]
MRVLTINLTAPLQSYGNQASFNRRSSSPYPTKSAIIGMVGAALGYRRDDERIRNLNDLCFAVRVDQVGTNMTDFQIVEYDATKHKKKLTYRDYLQDYRFVAAIGSDDDSVIDKIETALRYPRFQLYLGRRSNTPAGILKICKFTDISPIEVLTSQIPWQAATWYQKKYKHGFTAEIIADANLLPNQPVIMEKDQVGSFEQRNRYYEYRGVAKTHVEMQTGEHDIMSAL